MRATMMTGMLRRGEVGLLSWESPPEVDELGEVASELGLVMKVPTLLARSISRISRVASIPSLTGSWISICKKSVNAELLADERRTNQDEVEVAGLPLLNGFLSILSDGVLDPLLLHKHRQDCLVDGVVCTKDVRAETDGSTRSAPSTMRTLIGGTVGSVDLRVRCLRILGTVLDPDGRRP